MCKHTSNERLCDMADLDRCEMDTSRRAAKHAILMYEAQSHADMAEFVKAIADELSWRVVMRVVHKLRRKRGVEQ